MIRREGVTRSEGRRRIRSPDVAGAAVAPTVDIVEALLGHADLAVDPDRILERMLEVQITHGLLDIVVNEVKRIVEPVRTAAALRRRRGVAAGTDFPKLSVGRIFIIAVV